MARPRSTRGGAMKKVVLGFAAIATIVAFAAAGAVASNSPSGARGSAGCGGAACFVPSFPAVGSVVKYKSATAASVITFADCCLAGDKYKVAIRAVGSPSADTYQFTSFGSLNGGCDFAPYGNQRQVAPPG